jgi:hypothetical protein
VALRETPVLPEWSDLSGLFRRGLPLALARYLYFLPVSLVAGVAFFAGAASLFTIDTDYAAWGTVLGTLCGGGLLLSLALGFLVAAVSPAVTVRYLEGGTFASCFDWPGIWRHFRQHTPAHLAVFGWILAVSIGLALLVAPASVFLSFIPCLGAIAYPLLYAVLIAVLLFIFSHLEGQLFRAVLS